MSFRQGVPESSAMDGKTMGIGIVRSHNRAI